MKLVGDQDKSFAPHVICKICSSNLTLWASGKLKKLPFNSPMSWREQKHHTVDYYFCTVKISEFNRKNACLIQFPNIPSAIRPTEDNEIQSSSIVVQMRKVNGKQMKYQTGKYVNRN